MRHAVAAWVGMAVLAWAAGARAQGNYDSTPLGGRSALMGGTGVALGSDGAAPFLNPATIARIGDRSLAFSARFLRLSSVRIHNWHQPGEVDATRFGDLSLSNTDLHKLDLGSLPDSACYFFGPAFALKRRSGNQRFAICYAKPEQREFAVTALGFHGASAGREVSESETLRESWNVRYVGPAWGWHLSDRLALGASAYVARTSYEHSLSLASAVRDPSLSSLSVRQISRATSGESWDVLGELGITVGASDVITVGASFQLPGIHLVDDFSVGSAVSSESGQRFEHGDGSFVVRAPPRLALGIGAEWTRLRVELDAFIHASSRDFVRAESDREAYETVPGSAPAAGFRHSVELERSKPVTNMGLGVEYFATRDLSLLGGVGFDRSALEPRGSGSTSVFQSRLDRYFAGIGVTFYSSYGDIVLGTRLDYASGEMVAPNPFSAAPSSAVVDFEEIGATLVLAGRVSLGGVGQLAAEVQRGVQGTSQQPAERPRPAPGQAAPRP